MSVAARPLLSTSSTTTASFTSHLRDTILQSRSIIDTWVVAEKKRVDQHVATAKQELAAKQQVIDTTSAQLLALQLQYGCSVNDDSNMNHHKGPNDRSNNNKLSEQQVEVEEKVKEQMKKNHRLENELMELKQQTKELQIVADDGTSRAKAKQQQAITAAASKDMTVNDLTRGIVNYKYLGLDFQKADEDRLKFSFTQLDSNNPNQEYSFCLGTTTDSENDNDELIFSIFDCTPIQFTDTVLNELIDPLNRTDDMMTFVRNIRDAFLQQIHQSKSRLVVC